MDSLGIVLFVARLLLAVVFAVAGVAKLTDRAGSQRALTDFGVPTSLAAPLGLLLPLAEFAVAVALIPTATAWWGALGALALLLLFIVAISINLARGRKPDCRCFGQLHSAPVGWKTLVRNGLLGVVAAFVVWRGYDGTGPSVVGGVGDLSIPWLLGLLFGLVVLGLLLGAQWWFLLHLLRQNGRLLARFQALEARLGTNGVDGAVPSGNGSHQVAGLPVGSVAPAFGLPNLSGEGVTLDYLRAAGKPVVLIFTSPDCYYCTGLLPEIGRWQEKHAEKLSVALVSHLSVEENRAKVAEHGVKHVLVQEDWEVADLYQVEVAPSAVLVRPDGTIGSSLVEGPDAIEDLVAQALAPRAQLPMLQSTAENATPTSPKLGEPIPEVGLPDLEGRNVSLEDFRGEETLVLFWSPGCGFCQQMLPDLREWEVNPPKGAPKLLVVSEGSQEANKEMGFRSPVVLDQRFDVGRSLGAEGTPSAILVDAEGRVASELAVGAPAVLALAKAQ